MTLAAAILAGALTRAELIERFRTPPVLKVEGLVQVCADCPEDMRREFQNPVAGCAADVCRRLYAASGRRPRRFAEPGVSIHIGDVRERVTNVVSRVTRRRDGTALTKIFLPAPAFADLDALRRETARAYFRAVEGREVSDGEEEKALRNSDPAAKTEWEYGEIARWLAGASTDGGDEEMLRLSRAVLAPGDARPSDVLRFASRLYLYPEAFDSPFCGKFLQCDFRRAVEFADADPRLRFAAYAKAPTVVAYGGGRGDELYAAAIAYSEFLFELARWHKSREELLAMLDGADEKLNIAMEKARERHGDAK